MPRYIQTCNKCGAKLEEADRDKLAAKIVEHMKDVHQETLSQLDAINMIADRVRP